MSHGESFRRTGHAAGQRPACSPGRPAGSGRREGRRPGAPLPDLPAAAPLPGPGAPPYPPRWREPAMRDPRSCKEMLAVCTAPMRNEQCRLAGSLAGLRMRDLGPGGPPRRRGFEPRRGAALAAPRPWGLPLQEQRFVAPASARMVGWQRRLLCPERPLTVRLTVPAATAAGLCAPDLCFAPAPNNRNN